MIKVLHAGFYTSVQDLGRSRYGHFGVPVGGCLDRFSGGLANEILGNSPDDAVLEITLGKVRLLFDKQIYICITGANFSPILNERPIKMQSVVRVHKGEVLSFGKRRYGTRTYLAISGGIRTEKILGSRSFYKNITAKTVLKNNDILPLRATRNSIADLASVVKVKKERFTEMGLQAFYGPEFSQLPPDRQDFLKSQTFTISKDNNRMGYRLEEVMENSLRPILTSAVLPGTVQLTPSGKLIILMRDGQITGGYPRVLQLSEQAISRLAQKTTGDKVRFSLLKV